MKKILHLAKNVALSNLSELKHPYRLTYIVTGRCNLKCDMCGIWKQPVKSELSLEEINKFFKRSNRFSWINLSGGEIFLRKDLADIIHAIYRNCGRLYLLDFPTNGSQPKLIEETVRKVSGSCRIPKIMITVSLDGPAQIHDRIRGVPGSWDRAVETFERLRKIKRRGLDVFFGMTLQPSNADLFPETLKSVREKTGSVEHKDFHVNIMHFSEHYYGNKDCGKDKNDAALRNALNGITDSYNKNIFDPVGFLEKRYHEYSKIFLKTGLSPAPCQALSASFFMDPAGTVYPCSIYDRPIGNIADFDYDIYKLWDSDPRRKTRKDITGRGCPQCWTPCEAYQSILANLFNKPK